MTLKCFEVKIEPCENGRDSGGYEYIMELSTKHPLKSKHIATISFSESPRFTKDDLENKLLELLSPMDKVLSVFATSFNEKFRMCLEDDYDDRLTRDGIINLVCNDYEQDEEFVRSLKKARVLDCVGYEEDFTCYLRDYVFYDLFRDDRSERIKHNIIYFNQDCSLPGESFNGWYYDVEDVYRNIANR